MSLQDDYFDLTRSLRGENKKRMLRIWEAFCEMEKDYDKTAEIVRCFRQACSLTFERYNEILEEAAPADQKPAANVAPSTTEEVTGQP